MLHYWFEFSFFVFEWWFEFSCAQPYLHESRHLHALRRARGCGGRFLNTKSTDNGNGGSDRDKASDGRVTQADGSPSSEVLQSDSGNVNSAKEACGGSSLSSSEVTSMYSQGDLGRFHIEHPRSSAFHPHSNVMGDGQNINMATKWVAADGRCDFLKVWSLGCAGFASHRIAFLS